MKIHRFRREGSTLIVATILTLIIATTVGCAVWLTMQTARGAGRTVALDSSLAVADAYIEWAFAQWRSTCQAQANIPRPTQDFTITSPSSAYLPSPSGYSVANFQVQAVDAQLGSLSSSTAPPAASSQSTGDHSYFYLASVDISTPFLSKPVPVKMRRIFQKQVQSPWQYAIFFNDDLDIHPNPQLTVNGKVHTNGTLYASPDSTNKIFFQNTVTYTTGNTDGYAAGDYIWRIRGSAAGAANTFSINPTQLARQNPFGIDPSQFNNTNPNVTSYREIIERPDTGYTDAFQANNGVNPRFYDAASVKVLIAADNSLTILDAAGTNMATLGTAAEKTAATLITNAITTNQTVQDYREAAQVRIATLDVSLLTSAANGGSIPNWNGVIYLSDTSAGQDGTTNKRGIRLKNGSTLPTGGLTVASDNPVYVQGDYNTGGTRQPAAVVGDAINIYSNAWSDANASASLSSRTASSTTINAAFLSGIDPTVANWNGTGDTKMNYSGGVENFPRFHENWGGKTFTYNGSMVELFFSQQAIGRWGSASYNAPTRDWAFDTMYLTTPPPGNLVTINYIKQRSFQQF